MSTARLLADAIGRIAGDLCPPATVRSDEAGEPAARLWQAIAAAGLDRATAFVSTASGRTAPGSTGQAGPAGGAEPGDDAGPGWRDALPLVAAVGEFAMPVPLAESLGARALAGLAGIELADGAASFALLRDEADAGLVADAVPWGDRVVSVLGALPDGRLRVLAVADAQGVHGRNQAGEIRSMLRWPAECGRESAVRVPIRAVVELGAALRAAQLAGAMRSALRLAVRHAGDREQFGRPIGRFQAVQQQLASMAERVVQASVAAELAFQGEGPLPDPFRAACAKQVASANALECVAIAHAVHGAIGITAEHDLQLFTRRLRAWAAEWGGAYHWSLELGRGLVERPHASLWHVVIDASNPPA